MSSLAGLGKPFLARAEAHGVTHVRRAILTVVVVVAVVLVAVAVAVVVVVVVAVVGVAVLAVELLLC